MREIRVSTGVYARIWAHRMPGEETEDAILKRLLATEDERPSLPEDANIRLERSMERTLWRDDVKSALVQLGGSSPLASIYETVRSIRRSNGRRIPPSLEAIVRRELEYNSSDSESFTGRYDWFKSINGIGAGIWGLK